MQRHLQKSERWWQDWLTTDMVNIVGSVAYDPWKLKLVLLKKKSILVKGLLDYNKTSAMMFCKDLLWMSPHEEILPSMNLPIKMSRPSIKISSFIKSLQCSSDDIIFLKSK